MPPSLRVPCPPARPQVTSHIAREIAGSLQGLKAGLAHVFIQHTSASLTINENADPGVPQGGCDGECLRLQGPQQLAGAALLSACTPCPSPLPPMGAAADVRVDMETFLNKV